MLNKCPSISNIVLCLEGPERYTAEFTNNVDPDEVAYNEPPYHEIHCLPAGL